MKTITQDIIITDSVNIPKQEMKKTNYFINEVHRKYRFWLKHWALKYTTVQQKV